MGRVGKERNMKKKKKKKKFTLGRQLLPLSLFIALYA